MTQDQQVKVRSNGLEWRVVRLHEGIERLASERLVNRLDALKRHEAIVDLLERLVGEKRQAVPGRLNKLERQIVEALEKDTVTGEEIAERLGRNCNSNFKGTLSSMVKRVILGQKHPGYYVIHQSHDSGQD
jgi:hypothetical protein